MIQETDEPIVKVMGILTEVRLKGIENRRRDQLSGGQQQRVAIARATRNIRLIDGRVEAG